MSVYRTPDHLMATIEHLRGNSERYWPLIAERVASLHTLCAASFIDTEVTSDSGNHIIVRGPGGFGDLRAARGYVDGRLDVTCYSRQFHIARQMCAIVRDILFPVENHMRGWTASYTRVQDTHSFSTPLVDLEPGDGPVNPAWPFARMTGHVTYQRIAREAVLA